MYYGQNQNILYCVHFQTKNCHERNSLFCHRQKKFAPHLCSNGLTLKPIINYVIYYPLTELREFNISSIYVLVGRKLLSLKISRTE